MMKSLLSAVVVAATVPAMAQSYSRPSSERAYRPPTSYQIEIDDIRQDVELSKDTEIMSGGVFTKVKKEFKDNYIHAITDRLSAQWPLGQSQCNGATNASNINDALVALVRQATQIWVSGTSNHPLIIVRTAANPDSEGRATYFGYAKISTTPDRKQLTEVKFKYGNVQYTLTNVGDLAAPSYEVAPNMTNESDNRCEYAQTSN